MKMKFGALVVDGSGKIGGHVASKNRSGNYLRTKVTPVNPNTVAQQNVRAILGSLATAWSSLTDAQRLSWNNAVSEFAKTDIFGDIKNPSGFNLFIKLNSNLATIGNSPLTDAPIKEEIPYTGLTSAVMDISSATGVLTFDTGNYDSVSLFVKATPALSAGITNVKSFLRGTGVIIPAGDTASFYADYVAKFGIPAVGSNITLTVQPIVATGQKGVEQSIKVLVQA